MSYFDSIYADTLLPPRAVSVYMYLKDRSNSAGSCWPGIKTIARDMNLSRSIMTLPDGYQTKIGEGGSSLSGGEKQRISIARAILKDAPIVILDEATASVDPENEQELQKAIRELTKGKTILMIAHRLSTVRTADQIIVLENGRIIQRGNHKELMREDGLYRRFVGMRSQAIGWTLKGGKAHG